MKTTKDDPISPQQLKALHVSFKRIGMDEENRHNYIHHFTGGRTCSSKDLTMTEARRMLTALNGDVSAESRRLVGQIYGLSLRISFLNRDYPSDDEAERRMNYAKLNQFCRIRSRFRKNLTAMNPAELKEVKKQLEAVARKEEQERKKK